MLHLLPIQWLLRISFTVFSLAVLAALYVGQIGGGELAHDANLLFGWSSIAAMVVIVVSFAAWRWFPPCQD